MRNNLKVNFLYIVEFDGVSLSVLMYGVNKGNIGKTIIAYWIASVLCSAESDYNHVVLTTGLNSNTIRVTDLPLPRVHRLLPHFKLKLFLCLFYTV